jgi:hypothetical protein
LRPTEKVTRTLRGKELAMTAAQIIQGALNDKVDDPHFIFARLRNSGLTTEESCRALAGADIHFDGREIDIRVTTLGDNRPRYGFGCP